MKLVIVESPAKAKTINKYLGDEYKVIASFGHVRDLPPKDGSVMPDENFAMKWTTEGRSKEHLKNIADNAKNAETLILATDPDREGEAISWHILEELEKKKQLGKMNVQRVVFNAVTKKSILEAMENPREIDINLVDAYLARRSLDYLVGFTLSPVLWRRLPSARSAGRVQSVALRLICEREDEIDQFNPEEYWSINGTFANKNNEKFDAKISSFEGEKILKNGIKNQEQADKIKNTLMESEFKVQSVESKPVKRNPYAPFTTSTMQQEASGKLRFAASRTMQVAQKLYEGIELGGETVGLITYMRTDGVQMAPEAIEQTREVIKTMYGDNHLPEKARVYKSKAKNAQEAHEAVRPTDVTRRPEDVKGFLSAEQFQLYQLIWNRTVASQMESAQLERTTVEIEAVNAQNTAATMRANGSVVRFEGFLSVYKDTPKKTVVKKEDEKGEGENKSEAKDDAKEEDNQLPAMQEGESVKRESVEANQHFTEPPPRYSEASLIKKMEELGIGRPSTYASTLATLSNRGYVEIEQRRLTPVASGRLLTSFLQSFFDKYVEYGFTAELEEKLDLISDGELKWKDVLEEFWKSFSLKINEVTELRTRDVLDKLNVVMAPLAFSPKEDGSDPRKCPACEEGMLSLKTSRFGTFVGCENYPDCKFTKQLGQSDADAIILSNDAVLGQDPDTGEDIVVKNGRFGPYVERGEGKEGKRSSIPKVWHPSEVDMDKALKLLSLPRLIGEHPETKKKIEGGHGPYGPYIRHAGKYAQLENVDELFEIGVNHSVVKLAEAAAKPRRAQNLLKDLGEHPEKGGAVTIRTGRFGPYIKYKKINATIPDTTEPQDIEMDDALELIAQREAKMAEKEGKSPPAAKKKKVAAKKKSTAKKKKTVKKKNDDAETKDDSTEVKDEENKE